MLLAIATLACLAGSGLASLAGADTPAPARQKAAGPAARTRVTSNLSIFSAIHSGIVSDYNSCQLKLTYQGGQTKVHSSLAAASTLRVSGFVRPPFDPFQHHGSYNSDSFIGDTLLVGSGELKGLLDALAAHPAMQDTAPPALSYISAMVMRGYGAGAICWEHITGSTAEGDTLLQLLHDAVTAAADKATVDRFRHHLVGIRR